MMCFTAFSFNQEKRCKKRTTYPERLLNEIHLQTGVTQDVIAGECVSNIPTDNSTIRRFTNSKTALIGMLTG